MSKARFPKGVSVNEKNTLVRAKDNVIFFMPEADVTGQKQPVLCNGHWMFWGDPLLGDAASLVQGAVSACKAHGIQGAWKWECSQISENPCFPEVQQVVPNSYVYVELCSEPKLHLASEDSYDNTGGHVTFTRDYSARSVNWDRDIGAASFSEGLPMDNQDLLALGDASSEVSIELGYYLALRKLGFSFFAKADYKNISVEPLMLCLGDVVCGVLMPIRVK